MRYESLDFWRGVACLMVVIHHSAYYVHGLDALTGPLSLGVPMFFVISGYCIAAAGVLLYRAINYGGKLPAAALLVLGLAWLSRERYYVTAFGFGLALLALHRWDRQIANAPPLRPIVFCGAMTYSLYLVHWPVVKAISHLVYDAGLQSAAATLAVTVPLCVAASIVVAWPFHVLVERRFLNMPVTCPSP